MKTALFEIENAGEVIVNSGWVEAAGDRVVALCFDMKTKRPNVMATSAGDNCPPGVVLDGDGALHTDKSKRGEPTHVVFPEYPGWTVHSADVSKYTLRVCLTIPTPIEGRGERWRMKKSIKRKKELAEGLYVMTLCGWDWNVQVMDTMQGQWPCKKEVRMVHFVGHPRFPWTLSELIEQGATFKRVRTHLIANSFT